MEEYLLRCGVFGKFNALFDVAFKASFANFEQLLFLLGDTTEHVNGLLCSIELYYLLDQRARTT